MAKSAAERQKESRAKRKQQEHETTKAKQVSILLSAEATQAMEMLCYYCDMSQKQVIDYTLIATYKKLRSEKGWV